MSLFCLVGSWSLDATRSCRFTDMLRHGLLCSTLSVLSRAQFLPLPELPYQFEELEPHFSGDELRRHHKEVFGHYVERFNSALARVRHTSAYRRILKDEGIDGLLRRIREVPSKGLQRQVRQDGGGYLNHELFFRTLRPCRDLSTGDDAEHKINGPEGTLFTAIESSFGSFTEFRNEFSSIAQHICGSGWAWLVADLSTVGRGGLSLRIVETAANDHPLILSESYVPFLCLDVWEHAYFGQFHNNRKNYIEAWWNLVNWDEVGRIWSSFELDLRLGGIILPSADEAPEGVQLALVLATQQEAIFTSNAPKRRKQRHDFTMASMASIVDEVENEWESPVTSVSSTKQRSWSCEVAGRVLASLRDANNNTAQLRCEEAPRCPPCRLAVADTSFDAGDVLVVWPSTNLLGAHPTLNEHTCTFEHEEPGSLGHLVSILLLENRRTDSPWHDYLEFLHDEYGVTKLSALFWPAPLLRALDATNGFGDLRAAARAHRSAGALFERRPELLAPGQGGIERGQPLFDAEIHWAVATALCRGIGGTQHGGWWMLPGSELLVRGDRQSANVALVANDTTGVRSWSLVAVREIQSGETLVLDAELANVELLARAWAPVDDNTAGPVLHAFPFLNDEVVREALALTVAEILPASDASPPNVSEDSQAQVADEWRARRCDEELSSPRLSRWDGEQFPKALLFCVVCTIRLLESASTRSGLDEETPVDAVKTAYALIGQACGSTLSGYTTALEALDSSLGAFGSTDDPLDRANIGEPGPLLSGTFREVLRADVELLERCVAGASDSHRHRVLETESMFS